MRSLIVGLVAVITTIFVFDATPAEARCNYIPQYPEPTGKNTYMLATATSNSVKVALDTIRYYGHRTVPAQIMRVDSVAGFQSQAVRRGLNSTGGAAVFVRYGMGPDCRPYPAEDGMLDSAGVTGLYVGQVRAQDQWIDERPTFDVVMARHFPLPDRLSGASSGLMIAPRDPKPTMTAHDLFAMYRTLWIENPSADMREPQRRIREWVKSNPVAARQQPTTYAARLLLFSATEARMTAQTPAYVGTYKISVVVPGLGSFNIAARSYNRTRSWRTDEVRDSATGVPVSVVQRSFGLDLHIVPSVESFSQPNFEQCSSVVIVLPTLPAVARPDSTWSATLDAGGLFACEAGKAMLERLKIARVPEYLTSPVTFRQHANDRITFEWRYERAGSPTLIVRGERISKETVLYRGD